jgi:hypothetical protein
VFFCRWKESSREVMQRLCGRIRFKCLSSSKFVFILFLHTACPALSCQILMSSHSAWSLKSGLPWRCDDQNPMLRWRQSCLSMLSLSRVPWLARAKPVKLMWFLIAKQTDGTPLLVRLLRKGTLGAKHCTSVLLYTLAPQGILRRIWSLNSSDDKHKYQ